MTSNRQPAEIENDNLILCAPAGLNSLLRAGSVLLLLLGLSSFAAAQSFTPTGSMISSRDLHSATLLPNGKVLIAGGINPSGPIANAELYDPSTSIFSVTDSMSTRRYLHTATLLPNGKVLIAGGNDVEASNAGYASAELYDPATGLFSATGSMITGRYIHTATLLANGKVLIVGGNKGPYYNPARNAELYDPDTGLFSSAGDIYSPVFNHTATLLPDGKVLIAGGSDGAFPSTIAVLYDPAAGLFSPTGSMNYRREWHSATLLANGKVLVAGGETWGTPPPYTTASAELYDPATGLFSVTGSMNYLRNSHSSTLLPDGKVLIAGGGLGHLGLRR